MSAMGTVTPMAILAVVLRLELELLSVGDGDAGTNDEVEEEVENVVESSVDEAPMVVSNN